MRKLFEKNTMRWRKFEHMEIYLLIFRLLHIKQNSICLFPSKENFDLGGNRTRIYCYPGKHAHHYITRWQQLSSSTWEYKAFNKSSLNDFAFLTSISIEKLLRCMGVGGDLDKSLLYLQYLFLRKFNTQIFISIIGFKNEVKWF